MFMNEFGQGLSGMGFLFPGRGDWSRNWQKDQCNVSSYFEERAECKCDAINVPG